MKEIEKLQKAIDLMAHYIVELGHVDVYLCDEIPDSMHLQYQPANDGNYDNAPCIECVKAYYLWEAEKALEGQKNG